MAIADELICSVEEVVENGRSRCFRQVEQLLAVAHEPHRVAAICGAELERDRVRRVRLGVPSVGLLNNCKHNQNQRED